MTSKKIAAATRKQFGARLQAHARTEDDAPLTPRSKLLQTLYGIYKVRGARGSTDSNEMAQLFSIDQELVEGAAVELHKRNLVAFDACDRGLINLRLTTEGIEHIENPASDADWHSDPPG